MPTLGKSVKSCSIVCLFSRQWKLRIKVNVRGLIRTPTTNFYSIASYSLDQLYSCISVAPVSFTTRPRSLMQLGLKTVGINPVSFRPDFYILPARFLIFEQIRIQYGNTGYQIRNRDGNGLTVFPIVFGFPVFVRDIPLLPIRDIPFFCS